MSLVHRILSIERKQLQASAGANTGRFDLGDRPRRSRLGSRCGPYSMARKCPRQAGTAGTLCKNFSDSARLSMMYQIDSTCAIVCP